MNLNKVTLIGNLTADPKTLQLAGQSVTTFGLATNYRWRDYRTKALKESVEFHTIVAWRRIGEVVAKYLKKGDRVFLEGRLQTRSWQDKQGVKRYRTEVVADQLIMLGKASRAAEPVEQQNAELAEETVNVEEVPVEAEA